MVHEVNEAGIHERNGNMPFPLLVIVTTVTSHLR